MKNFLFYTLTDRLKRLGKAVHWVCFHTICFIKLVATQPTQYSQLSWPSEKAGIFHLDLEPPSLLR